MKWNGIINYVIIRVSQNISWMLEKWKKNCKKKKDGVKKLTREWKLDSLN